MTKESTVYEVLFTVPDEFALDEAVHKGLFDYYSVSSNQGKPCFDISLKVAYEFTHTQWVSVKEGSPAEQMIRKAMADPRFRGLIVAVE